MYETMKVSPYELVFGHPPCKNIFPGACTTRIMEQDLEDIFESNNQLVCDTYKHLLRLDFTLQIK